MRLMSFKAAGVASWGVVEGERVIDLGSRAPSLRAALGGLPGVAADTAGLPRRALADVAFLPPIPDPDKIICIGLNYLTHIQEGGREPPTKPTIFTRWANSQVGHGQAIVRPRHVTEADAMDVIAGYSCYNDGSVREWQRHSSQFGPGKNFPATGGFGPYLVTPDEAGDVTHASLVTRLNGEEMQRATTDDLVFTIPKLIAYCSTFTELVPGDVIITGTTGGVGAYRTPPVWMKPGDIVEVEISGVGLLRNTVAQEI